MLKNIYVEGIGEVVFARRRGTRSIRLSINGGRVRIGAPYSVSEQQALGFLASRQDWILKHIKPVALLGNGTRIGKAHHLRFEPGSGAKPTTKLTAGAALVRLPAGMDESSKAAQDAAKRIAKKALQAEAENLFPQRLATLAQQMGANYRSLKIKFINSRWGSCSNQNDIGLNAYLMQLPWPIIDYVIVHELAHTWHHNHSPAFWDAVENVIPDYKNRRKTLKSFHTDVLPGEGLAA